MGGMSRLRRTIGVVLFVVGLVWFLLGVGLVQGSVMTGRTWAAVVGAIALIAGLFTLNAHKRPLPRNLDKPSEPGSEADSPSANSRD